MIPGLLDHLWQSTLFLGAAWLLTLALRKNQAQVRHWIWFTASVKFLVPFSLLVGLGSLAPRPAVAPPVLTVWVAAAEQIGEPLSTLSAGAVQAATARPSRSYLAAAALVLWGCGFAAIAICWLARWRHVHALRRSATLVSSTDFDVPIMSAPGLIGPGIFGVFRPVLLLPEGIGEQFDHAQMDAILAHELCHVRRHDNLTAMIHMIAQAIFWFHPLVWWLGSRLVEERERACDEEVLRLGSKPRAYAEGILNVYKLYVESPLPCVSGVTGSNLKRRIEAIMKNRRVLRLNFGKKLALSVAGIAALAAPIIVGLAKAQTNASPAFEVASLREVRDADGRAVLSMTPRRTEGRFTWTAPIPLLSSYAYHLPQWRISGIDKKAPTFYVIAATTDASATEDQVRLMLQALLVDRFKIVSHRETKEFQGYALVAAKNGPKLKAANGLGEAPPMPDYWRGKPLAAFEGRIITSAEGIGTSALTGRGVSSSQLADELSENLGAFVLDQTGLTGKYYFGFKFLSVAHPSDDVDAASIFSAVQDELGLKLEKQKGPVEVLVIDHVEKPSEN